MTCWRAVLIGLIVSIFGWSERALAQDTIFESATPPSLSDAGQYAVVDNNFWQGVLFTTVEDFRVTALGGVMHANNEGDTFFIAVFPTDGVRPPSPPDIEDAVFVQVVTPVVNPDPGPLGAQDLEDTRLDLAPGFILPAGDWYICFGSGAADTAGTGRIRMVDTEVGTPKYVNKNASGWYGPTFSRGFRFFVEGRDPEPRCGDGFAEAPDEECDDGNVSNRDACLNNCKNAYCGDGFRNLGEACDDGNLVQSDGCSNECALPTTTPEPRTNPSTGRSGCALGARNQRMGSRTTWVLIGLFVVAARRGRTRRQTTA